MKGLKSTLNFLTDDQRKLPSLQSKNSSRCDALRKQSQASDTKIGPNLIGHSIRFRPPRDFRMGFVDRIQNLEDVQHLQLITCANNPRREQLNRVAATGFKMLCDSCGNHWHIECAKGEVELRLASTNPNLKRDLAPNAINRRCPPYNRARIGILHITVICPSFREQSGIQRFPVPGSHVSKIPPPGYLELVCNTEISHNGTRRLTRVRQKAASQLSHPIIFH